MQRKSGYIAKDAIYPLFRVLEAVFCVPSIKTLLAQFRVRKVA